MKSFISFLCLAIVVVAACSSCWCCVVVASAEASSSSQIVASGNQKIAFYASLSKDAYVRATASNPARLLTVTFTVPATTPAGTDLLLVSDGRFYPTGASTQAAVRIVDGKTGAALSSTALIDWKSSKYPVQHSYSCLGMLQNVQPRATYSIALAAYTLGGIGGESFAVGAGSNLIVVEVGTNKASLAMTTSDSPVYRFNVTPTGPGGKAFLPIHAALSVSTRIPIFPPPPVRGPIVALAAGYSRAEGTHYGDAVWLLYKDEDTSIANNNTMHSDNDLWIDAESGGAPMFTHGYWHEARGSSVSLGATAEAWGFCCNQVHYRIGAGAALFAVALLPVMGSFSLDNQRDVPNTYSCVGSSTGWPGCPPINATYAWINTSFSIPPDHSGVGIFFSFKTLVQADEHDIGGTVAAQLAIDGRRVGSVALQQLQSPDCVSTRTITASYVSTSATALASGTTHTLQVLVDVSGSFIHLSFGTSLSLVWFSS